MPLTKLTDTTRRRTRDAARAASLEVLACSLLYHRGAGQLPAIPQRCWPAPCYTTEVLASSLLYHRGAGQLPAIPQRCWPAPCYTTEYDDKSVKWVYGIVHSTCVCKGLVNWGTVAENIPLLGSMYFAAWGVCAEREH
ncbi:unnamed protein product [Boreogadus saida]